MAANAGFSTSINYRNYIINSKNDTCWGSNGSKITAYDWENWMISPAPNGTLGLQSKLNVASISMGDEEYSYYSCRDGREDWGDFVPFTPSGFLEVMRRIV